MSTIDDLKAKVQSLTDQLKNATEKYHRALIEAQPLRVGDRMVKNGVEAEISAIHVKYNEDIYLYGRKVLKTGKLHANEHQLWGEWKPKAKTAP